MENLFKKEYEISLWEDELHWHRRKLQEAQITEEEYKPGLYYTASAGIQEYGARQYFLSLDSYNDQAVYYTLASKEDDNFLEGASAESVGISPTENSNWYTFTITKDAEPKGNKSYYYLQGGKYTLFVDKNFIPQVDYFEATLVPNTIFQFFREKKICVIGSDTMDTPIRVHNPKLVANTNGSSTLTFTLYYKYYDEDSQELVDNPFAKMLVNERKIKLRHGPLGADNTKWYDFVIKNVSEDSENFTFTYTAKNLFINELSKSGFDIQLDVKLENNQGSILELGRKVLEDSDWQIVEDADIHLQQTKSEALYEFVLSESIDANSMKNKNASITIEAGQKIYGFYNCVAEKLSFFQFLYVPNESYEVDEERHITNSPNYYIDNTQYTTNGFPNFTIYQIDGQDAILAISTKYRGKRVVRQPKTTFDPIIDKYVSVYKDKNGKEVYGFMEDEIISPSYVRNFVVNSKDYDSLSGWATSGYKTGKETVQPKLELATIPDVFKNYDENIDYVSYLKVNFENVNQGLVNFGITENRSTLNGFTKGQGFVLRLKYGFLNGEEIEYKQGKKLKVSVFKYSLKDGIYEKDGENILDFVTYIDGRDDDEKYYVLESTCATSTSYSDMTKSKYALFIQPLETSLNQDIYIEDVQLFYKEEVESKLVYPGDVFETNLIKEKYKYYYKIPDIQNIDDIEFIYEGAEPSKDYVQMYNDESGYEKIRSITASESNRFNLIQDLCEIFECWPQFIIDHNELTGEILLDENYRQRKWVNFKEFIGKQNDIGFRYGINLKSIKRTIDSDNIVTKMIVKNNANEYATDGFCSVARATENPNRENFLLEFDYYISQGLLDFDQIWNDLYTKTGGYIGYYIRLKEINILEDKLIIEQSELVVDEPNLEAELQTLQTLYDESNTILNQKLDEVLLYTGYSFEALTKKYDSEVPKKIQQWQSDNTTKGLCATIAKLKNSIKKIEDNLNVARINLDNNKTNQQAIQAKLDENKNKKLALDLQFYKKYSRFLQEGSWIDENYVDDNLYYLDAESTLYTSAHPKITYDINVLELSKVPDYENYIFNLGDKTFIEDTEFFGWTDVSGVRTPRHEEIIVNEITIMLDSPEQNQIKVQNYKTQFEDLFQRITATTQAVEYSSGKYEKVTHIVQSDGTIMPDTLSNSMVNNSFVISNARDQSVTWDETGISSVNLSNPNERIRIISGGVFLSKDGGLTWSTGVTGNGINASYLTSGQIDTSQVRIMAGAYPSFRWDASGLNAYEFVLNEDKQTGTDFNFSKFVRFDQYGIYGIDGEQGFNPAVAENGKVGEGKIWNKAKFALTWSGFVLNNDDNSVRISSDNDIQVLKRDDNGNSIARVTLGRLGNNQYGLRIKNDENEEVMLTKDDGSLWLSNILHIGGSDSSINNSTVKIGYLPLENQEQVHKVIQAGSGDSEFIVYEDGRMYAAGAEFRGTIHATGGTIGGLTIDQLISGGYTVEIISETGYIFKNNSGEKTFSVKISKGDVDLTDNITQVFWYLNSEEIKDGVSADRGLTVKIQGKNIGESSKLSCKVVLNEEEE